MKRLLPHFAVIAALGLTTATHAADVGRVLLAAGDTVAIRGNQTVRLTFGTMVQDKDLLRTGAASNLQVRFIDESIVSMKEASELRIDDFRFSGKEDGSERGFLSLLKGGLRTVTGLIGRSNNANYRLSTVTATIGIRGTDYAATLCQGDCRNNDGSLAKDGLYGRTHGISHGTNRIDVSNERDQKSFGINENFYVADAKSIVEPLLVAPDFVSNKLEGRKQGGGKGESGGSGTEQATTGGAAAESRPSTTPEPLPQLQFVATQDLGPQGTPAVLLPPADGFIVVSPFAGVIFDDIQIALMVNSLNQLTAYGTLGTFPAGSLNGGAITDTGSLTLSTGQIITWGRWTGNTLITSGTGPTVTGSPLLFLTASDVKNGNDVISSIGGVATYTYAGGPSPVDAGGNVGSITSTSATINFTLQTAALSLGVNFPSIVASSINTGPASFSVSGSGVRVNNPGTDGDFIGGLSGTCTGSGCLSGTGPASGFFETGTTGANGYEFAVFGGLLSATNAGDVAFLNAYLNSSFTPGPAPASKVLAAVVADATLGSNRITLSQFNGDTLTFSGPNLTAFNSSAGAGVFPAGSLNGGSVVETGSVAAVDGSVMNWGRWVGSTVNVVGLLGTYVNPPTGLSYVYGDRTAALPSSGSFTYSYAGGPNPVNAAGNVGTFSSGSFSVNFGATSTIGIATPLALTVAGASYALTSLCGGLCTFTSPGFTGTNNLSGTCSGGTCGGGTAVFGALSGQFTGTSAGGLAITGAVGSTNVTFTGAFKR